MAKRHWLMKTEPGNYSIADLEGEGTTPWEGIRNYAARNHMRAMTRGDAVLLYHSGGKSPGVAGIAEVAREAYPDPLQFDPKSRYFDAKSPKDAPRWDRVDISFVSAFPRLVPLAEIRATPELAELELLRQMRLSVTPVRPGEFQKLVALSRVS